MTSHTTISEHTGHWETILQRVYYDPLFGWVLSYWRLSRGGGQYMSIEEIGVSATPPVIPQVGLQRKIQ